MRIVRKIKRILFIVGLTSVCLLSCYILYLELRTVNVFGKLKNDPSLLILIFTILLSILSLFFNLEKIAESQKKSNIYKITRIGDLVFSIYLFGLIVTVIVLMIGNMNRSIDRGFEIDMSRYFIPIIILFVAAVLDVLLFIDNFKFHRSFKNMPKGESIDDIGKRPDETFEI